tara:strand:- start:331 stop:639 length:309 start_codon:yes stop_codon:yes gene_type:complete
MIIQDYKKTINEKILLDQKIFQLSKEVKFCIYKILKKGGKIFLYGNGGIAKKFSDYNLIVPSFNTARIQETHIFLGHFIFEQVENFLIKKLPLKMTFLSIQK